MSCSPFDLKDYFLQELPTPQRLQVEAHVEDCMSCREELDRLQLTGAALFTLRDEEIPQRIAFVSDQIFEPSPVRRWFSGFWGSAARLGFASALTLSASLVYFAAARPAPAPVRPAVPTMAAGAPSPEQVQQQIQEAVAKAVAGVEARQAIANKQLVAGFEQRIQESVRYVQYMESEAEADPQAPPGGARDGPESALGRRRNPMRTALAAILLSAIPGCCQIARKVPAETLPKVPVPVRATRIPANSIRELERFFNYRLTGLVKDVDQPAELMGDTRGVQMEDYGVVFTAEISLVQTPSITPFMQKIPPELAARIRQFRVDRLPVLKVAMKEMMRSIATQVSPQVPATQQVVLVVRLYYGVWEDTTGMPKEVMMRATRAAAAAGTVETEER